jgi:hypothetical protein
MATGRPSVEYLDVCSRSPNDVAYPLDGEWA